MNNRDAKLPRTHPLSSTIDPSDLYTTKNRLIQTNTHELPRDIPVVRTGLRGLSSMTPFQRHEQLMRVRSSSRYSKSSSNANTDISDHNILNIITDESLLRSAYRFMPTEADDDGSYESDLAQRYYSKLFREYVIADLSRYTTGALGLRWRTEQEVLRGKGQFICGARGCEYAEIPGMSSYEVLFEYKEPKTAPRSSQISPDPANSSRVMESKSALVKVRLCRPCAAKLHHQQLQARPPAPAPNPAAAVAPVAEQEQGQDQREKQEEEEEGQGQQGQEKGELGDHPADHRSQGGRSSSRSRSSRRRDRSLREGSSRHSGRDRDHRRWREGGEERIPTNRVTE